MTQNPAPFTHRLGEYLLHQGLLTPDQIEVALHEKARSGKMLGAVLVQMGFISETDLANALASRSGTPAFDTATTLVDLATARTLPRMLAETHRMALLAVDDGTAALAMADPYDVLALDAARRALPGALSLAPLVITAPDLADLHDFVYGYDSGIDTLLQTLRDGGARFTNAELSRGLRHPVVRLVSLLLLDAVKQRASDVHFEPEAYSVRVRLRVDGLLRHAATLHRDYWSALSHRLKIMAGMNIADRLSPQDGRFTLALAGRTVDFRMATLPGAHGENIAVRVLDAAGALRTLPALALPAPVLSAIQTMLRRPEGLVVVTGPTGSGKTTTLYAALQQLADVRRNVMTLEDPIEYQLPLVRQTQVNPATGIDFATGVRSILRQDPDVILIGEIRDAETAQMAMRAAMTGHLVLTTLHTRDALGTLPRLHDLGLTPALLAGNLNGMVAQRLVRRLCSACKQPGMLAADDATLLGMPAGTPVFTATGCAACGGTGYNGRVPVAEAVVVDGALDALVASAAPRGTWRSALAARGWQSLLDSALVLLRAGVISVESLYAAVDVAGLHDVPQTEGR